MNIYCLKCKKKTANSGKSMLTMTKNGRKMAKTHCAVCKTAKNQFVSQNMTGKGLFGDILSSGLNVAGSLGGAYLGQPFAGNLAGKISGNLARKIPF